MFLISNGLIVLAHLIGHPIVKSLFGKDVFYTWRTSLAGIIVYTIIIVVGLIGLTIYSIGRCLLIDAQERFYEPEYGELISETINITQ